ncbi:MAG: carbohydrate ABC transporter permease, partial [Clostridia bacterium]|nr:carbohydrate ABC transporter permease [Clostridia bacterium]
PIDYRDSTVVNVPRNLSLLIYKAIFTDGGYLRFFFKSLGLSLGVAVLQTLSCCLVGYGLAKFKFRGSKIIFFAVILTLVVPHGTLQAAIYNYFSKLSLLNTIVPLLLLSITALAFKNGLYIFLLRQFFRGVPDELEESAYLDGANTFRTFIQVILPISVPMMITVFLFSFCWQWTDDFYLNLFFISTPKPEFMAFITDKELTSLVVTATQAGGAFETAQSYAFGLMACIPLIILFLFCQKYLVQGIERSGIVG